MAPSKDPLLSGVRSRGIDEGRQALGLRLAKEEDERAYDKSQQIDMSQYDDKDDEDVESGDYTPKFSWKKLWLFTGPGFLMSIAYLDPGNIESDIQAGAGAGYSLLWLLMWATVMGCIVQLLAARLGVATGCHLAELCREEYPFWARILLWLMTEIAIIGADIQEVIGSAIAFRILANGMIPLWAGVLITGVDGFVFLLLEQFGVRKLEALFGGFISIMAISFAWMFAKTDPDGKAIITGLVIPTVPSNAVNIAVGIVGCVIMPHNIFLHSALVQSRSLDITKKSRLREALRYYTIESSVALCISFMINMFIMAVFAKGFYGQMERPNIGLINAGEYLEKEYGGGYFPILYIWAIGLLMAGQSSTMTGTYTGQFVMSGFLDLPVKKWVRVIVTRSVAIVPTIIIALIFDGSENNLDRLNEWLNVLQSIQLPFALIPLLCLVSNQRVMGVFTISRLMKVVVGLIAILVMAINFYLMVVFVWDSNLQSVLALMAVALGALGYFGFIVYLLLQPSTSDGLWATLTKKNDYRALSSDVPPLS
ncbi:natural resistance-associated macrophage protein 2 [Marchantia polymorpha subsp. ruderalis]|uniref:Uncharacterized protein n=2 Tax=Marchantia polymorpha TaxID=3197 RepID=A0A176WG70_MARPO|nr:hypothetical protein AXG93_2294s1060 [Marchantia polymorpha subsp. ruderalis]PTQ31116.1 hypothetical protein MARPO_0115s0033 [Marchantia polymorpha]BBN07938.1 hypothetical protein Mp_4g07480 [Marchantia polymorpha subsp. ruderalis]|eukprot:PTQ31116.1 hypothetical protein MARPO_0115s0033 [Marchantia polymorpha]